MKLEIVVREASVRDDEAIAQLCQQLGYSVSPQAVTEYLCRITQVPPHTIFLACDSSQRVLGLINLTVTDELLTGKQVEIAGFVVNESDRSQGIGRCLLDQANHWAKRWGCSTLQVRVRNDRHRSHEFYQKQGFHLIKTQQVFQKRIP